MEKSENINELAKALQEFQSEMPKLSRSREVKVKTKGGGSYGFKYTPLEQILEEVLPLLGKYGLTLSQFPSNNASITNILMHESGQWISETASFDSRTQSPQDLGGILTYLRRYSVAGILGIITDEDDDANSASGNVITSQKDYRQNTRKKSSSNGVAKKSKPAKAEKTDVEVMNEDDIVAEINSKETVEDVVIYFNKKVGELKGKEKDEFRNKYGRVANERVQAIKSN